MNTCFESPDGVVGVSYPDQPVGRPRLPVQPNATRVPQPEFVDILLSWYPCFTDRPPTHVPARPARIGVTNIFEAGIAPMAWEPHLRTFIDAPRVHRVFGKFGFDPLTGAGLVVAAQMAWDPRQHPIYIRRKLKETTAVFYQPPLDIVTGSLTCTAFANFDETVPELDDTTLTQPQLLDAAVTIPVILNPGVC